MLYGVVPLHHMNFISPFKNQHVATLNLDYDSSITMQTRVESGLDLDMQSAWPCMHAWVTFQWVTKIIWMWPGYHMFFRKQCWHLHGKWVNFGVCMMNALKYHCMVWNMHACMLIVFNEACDVQRFHLQEVYMQGIGSVSCQEWIYGSVPYQKFFMSCYITIKKKISTCESHAMGIYTCMRIVLYNYRSVHGSNH